MSNDDKDLSIALTVDEQRVIDEMPDYDNIFTLMSRSYRSGMRPFVILLVVLSTLVTGFCVYSIWKIFRAQSTQHQILWSLAATGSFVWVGLAKVWFWMQLERQKLLMELKRAELRILAVIESKG